jgi:hypothetical protein
MASDTPCVVKRMHGTDRFWRYFRARRKSMRIAGMTVLATILAMCGCGGRTKPDDPRDYYPNLPADYVKIKPEFIVLRATGSRQAVGQTLPPTYDIAHGNLLLHVQCFSVFTGLRDELQLQMGALTSKSLSGFTPCDEYTFDPDIPVGIPLRMTRFHNYLSYVPDDPIRKPVNFEILSEGVK